MAKLKQADSQNGGEQPVLVLNDGTEISLDEIDNNVLMHSDYTKKTQAIAAERKALEEAKANQVVNTVVPSQPDGNKDKAEMTKMYLETKMAQMRNVYGEDFNEVEVLNKASNMLKQGISPTNIDFDDIHKAMAFGKHDVGSVKEQMKAEILKELAANNIDTSSIIGSGDGAITQPANFGLSQQELNYCAKTGEDPESYAKYKNMLNG